MKQYSINIIQTTVNLSIRCNGNGTFNKSKDVLLLLLKFKSTLNFKEKCQIFTSIIRFVESITFLAILHTILEIASNFQRDVMVHTKMIA